MAAGMERMEGMLRNLKLSEAEMAGLKISEQQMEIVEGSGKEVVEARVMAKVLSERLASAEGVKQALGPIWCPIRGIKCTRRGENIFMITLLQPSGKKKALDCGPWRLNNDLVVVEEYDPEKSVEEYKFSAVPIWIRILKLPLGKMNKATGEMIGEKIGEWLEADVGEDDHAVGESLHIKVRIDITKPLMRGMMIQVGEDGRCKWCPFEYEFLPEFCYICGVIGHDDKSCLVQAKKGEEKQFGSWLRAYIPKKQSSSEKQRWSGGGGSGSGSRSYGFGDRRGTAGSNSLSWRKEDSNKTASANENPVNTGKEEEVTSPLKKKDQPGEEFTNGQKKTLVWNAEPELKENEAVLLENQQKSAPNSNSSKEGGVAPNTGEKKVIAQQVLPLCPAAVQLAQKASDNGPGSKEVEKSQRDAGTGLCFQRKSRSKRGDTVAVGVKIGTKRNPDQMEVDGREGQTAKKGRFAEENNVQNEAGLSEQPCETQ